MVYTVLADETADISGKEQLSIGLRFYDESKEKVRKEFVGFVELTAQDASTIAKAIDNILVSYNFLPQNCVGLGFDGCATMAENPPLGGILHLNFHDYVRQDGLKNIKVFDYLHKISRRLSKHLKNNLPKETTRKSAYQLHSAVTKSSLVVALTIVAKHSALLEPVLNALQALSIDLIQLQEHINVILNVLNKNRQDADLVTAEIIIKAQDLVRELEIEISIPRLDNKQIHRSNYPLDSDSDYWKCPLIIPYLDLILSSLNSRFSQEHTPAFALTKLHPLYMLNMDISHVKENTR
ncbi:unnamed protein product [Psylliodes chrysocephalus]|uniref:DUF4371 domain-containing protein n=1 Tax=Psylliodes chrysocephalus TaxID=3402493 RepID=A0A9P0GL97_9CUCU|nr:unnamed protein product [Psylliodes chrysocephala]